MSDDKFLEHHRYTQAYISDYIQFADAKAGVTLGITLAILVFFANIVREHVQSCLDIYLFLILVGIGMLILAVYYFLWKVIWPRYVIDKTAIMSWGGIAAYSNDQEYWNALKATGEVQLLGKQAAQSYALAQVCRKKYENLRLGFMWLTLGSIISSLVWFLRS